MSNEIVELQLRAIPNYSADDYYSTSEPFEFLYAYVDNKFLLSQMRERMKAQAASVGVRGFIGLWNAFLELKSAKRGIIIDNATAFEGQTFELFSGQYTCDEHGVTFVDRFGYDQVVCRHPIMPIRRLVNIDTGEERLEIAFKKGRLWRSIVVEKSVVSSATGILSLAANGVMVNSENAKLLSSYLFEMEQLNYDIIPEDKSVSRLGWVGNHGFAPYVDGLTFDGESNFRHIFNAVQSKGDYDKWLDAMRKMRAEKTPGRLFLAASFASVLLEPCGLLNFFLHSFGGTGNGKTVGLMIAASVWGNPKMGEYITSFNSTGVGQEMTAAFLNSLPMCIDELQIQASDGVRDFDKMIYQLTEGVGKTRGAKTGGLQRLNKWRCCFITSGEQPITRPNSGGGAVNRIIEFECCDKVYSDLVGISELVTANYGYAGRHFIELFKEGGESAINFVNSLQKDFYRELLKLDSTDKQAASASALLAADAIATDWIFKDGNALTVSEIAEFMRKKEEVNINARAYEYVSDLVARNPNKFKPNDFGSYQGEVWGKLEGDNVYIIKSVFDREMALAGFNSVTFLSWAKRNDNLITDDSRRTKRARVNGIVSNCVCIVMRDNDVVPDTTKSSEIGDEF